MSTAGVNIEGLDKVAVLVALYNASSPQGLGRIQSVDGLFELSSVEARKLFDFKTNPLSYFECIHGRPLKVDLSSDTEFSPWGYDRDNGGDGAAQSVIDHLRETGNTSSLAREQLGTTVVGEGEAMMRLLGLTDNS